MEESGDRRAVAAQHSARLLRRVLRVQARVGKGGPRARPRRPAQARAPRALGARASASVARVQGNVGGAAPPACGAKREAAGDGGLEEEGRNMNGRRAISTLLLAAALLVTGSANGVVGNCDQTSLRITTSQSSGREVYARIDNPEAHAQSAYLVVTVRWNGSVVDAGFPVTVAANSYIEVWLTFPTTVTLLGIEVCEQLPGGVSESPDPVGVHIVQGP